MVSREKRIREREMRRQLSTWTRRRIAAWSMFVLAIVMAIMHVFAHGGWKPIPLSMGWQDLLLGYPMAAVIFVAGAMILDPHPTK